MSVEELPWQPRCEVSPVAGKLQSVYVCARARTCLLRYMITGSRCAWSDGVTAQHNRLPDWCNLYIFCHYRQKFSRIHFSPFLNSQFVYFRSFFITWLIIWHKIRWQQAFPARDRTDLPVYLFWNVHVCFQWGWWWYYKFGLKSKLCHISRQWNYQHRAAQYNPVVSSPSAKSVYFKVSPPNAFWGGKRITE